MKCGRLPAAHERTARATIAAAISGRAILEQCVTFRGLITIAKDESGSARKLLILNGEMSEWLKEHAWK
jgi:hypothetical protein